MNDLDPREHRKAARDCNRWHVIQSDHAAAALTVFYLRNGSAGELEHYASARTTACTCNTSAAPPDCCNTAYIAFIEWQAATHAAATREAHRRNVITAKRRHGRRGGM